MRKEIVPAPEVLENRRRQEERQEERMRSGRSELFREGLRELNDLPYREDGEPEHLLDLLLPEKADGLLPVIAEIHGGAYVACDKEVNRLHARWYAQQGFAVVNGNYTRHPEGNFADEMNEIADILRWVADHAEEYSLDPERIFLSGDSAGGHLVLLYAVLQGNAALQKKLGVVCPEQGVSAVAATCPLFRLRGGKAEEAVKVFLGWMYPNGVTGEYLDLLDVEKQIPESEFPPIILINTPGDGLTYEEDLELEEALRKSGRDYALKIYESRENELGHVFNVLFPEWPESGEANRDILAFFRRCGSDGK